MNMDIFVILQILIVTLTFIIISLVIFFFLGVHLDGWAEGLALLFIPEVCKSVLVADLEE